MKFLNIVITGENRNVVSVPKKGKCKHRAVASNGVGWVTCQDCGTDLPLPEVTMNFFTEAPELPTRD